mgnify:FL=1
MVHQQVGSIVVHVLGSCLNRQEIQHLLHASIQAIMEGGASLVKLLCRKGAKLPQWICLPTLEKNIFQNNQTIV